MILNKQYIVFDDPNIHTDSVKIGDILIPTKLSPCGQGVEGLIVNDKEIPTPDGCWCHFLVEESIEYLTELDEKAIKEVSSILQEQSNQIMNRLIKLDAMLVIKDYD